MEGVENPYAEVDWKDRTIEETASASRRTFKRCATAANSTGRWVSDAIHAQAWAGNDPEFPIHRRDDGTGFGQRRRW